jgi:hypothetical protein
MLGTHNWETGRGSSLIKVMELSCGCKHSESPLRCVCTCVCSMGRFSVSGYLGVVTSILFPSHYFLKRLKRAVLPGASVERARDVSISSR